MPSYLYVNACNLSIFKGIPFLLSQIIWWMNIKRSCNFHQFLNPQTRVVKKFYYLLGQPSCIKQSTENRMGKAYLLVYHWKAINFTMWLNSEGGYWMQISPTYVLTRGICCTELAAPSCTVNVLVASWTTPWGLSFDSIVRVNVLGSFILPPLLAFRRRIWMSCTKLKSCVMPCIFKSSKWDKTIICYHQVCVKISFKIGQIYINQARIQSPLILLN